MTDTLIAQLQARNEALTVERDACRDESRRIADALADSQVAAEYDRGILAPMEAMFEAVGPDLVEAVARAYGSQVECERLRAALQSIKPYVNPISLLAINDALDGTATPVTRPPRDEPTPVYEHVLDGRYVVYGDDKKGWQWSACVPGGITLHPGRLTRAEAVARCRTHAGLPPLNVYGDPIGYAPAPTADLAASLPPKMRAELVTYHESRARKADRDAARKPDHPHAAEQNRSRGDWHRSVVVALCAPVARSEQPWMDQAFGVIVAWAKSRDDVPAEVDEAIEALRDALPCDAFQHVARSEPTRADGPTIAEIKRRVASRPSGWREGQAAFNYLSELSPAEAEAIRGTRCDPFFDDKRLPAFWERLQDVIDEQTQAAEDQPQPACPPAPDGSCDYFRIASTPCRPGCTAAERPRQGERLLPLVVSQLRERLVGSDEPDLYNLACEAEDEIEGLLAERPRQGADEKPWLCWCGQPSTGPDTPCEKHRDPAPEAPALNPGQLGDALASLPPEAQRAQSELPGVAIGRKMAERAHIITESWLNGPTPSIDAIIALDALLHPNGKHANIAAAVAELEAALTAVSRERADEHARRALSHLRVGA